MQPDNPTWPRIYHEKRFFFVAVGVLFGAVVLNPPVLEWFFGESDGPRSAVYLGYALAVVLAIGSWKATIRIDEKGISRRGFFFGKTWPWEDFQTGRIHKGMGRYYYGNPNSGRAMPFDAFSEENTLEILSLCRRFWVPPPSPTLPEEMVISQGGNVYRLHRTGIKVQEENIQRSHAWDGVRRILVEKIHHDDEDFALLRMELPGTALVLRASLERGWYRRDWSGPDAPSLLHFITEHARNEKIQYSTQAEDKSVAERIKRLESAARDAKLKAIVCPVVSGFVAFQCCRSAASWIPQGILALLVFGGVGLYLTVDSYPESKQKEAELQRLRARPPAA